MYAMRFTDEDVTKMTMQQLRGREGARVRSVYRSMARKTGVPWSGREYNPDDFEAGDPVNKALSAAHACLYGVAHSVIVALGCSPGLGFIHTGHERSFVYDIADLYKAEITIPIAFEIAASSSAKDDIGAITRRAVRDAISNGHILVRAVQDISKLLKSGETEATEKYDYDIEADILQLWDNKNGDVKSAVAYGRELDMEDKEGGLEEGELEEGELEEDGYGNIVVDEL
jgi:CRISPR-associated protein Cas1